MRRSRNFLRYTNIRRRQKSERCGGDTQAKCPNLPDNLRLHFFVFFFPPMAGKISAVRDPSDGPGRRPPAGLLRWNRCCGETGRATRSLDELFSSSLFGPRQGGVGGQKSTRSCVAGRGSASTAPSETNAHFPPSSTRPSLPSSGRQSGDRTEKLVSELHRKSTHKHRPPLDAN